MSKTEAIIAETKDRLLCSICIGLSVIQLLTTICKLNTVTYFARVNREFSTLVNVYVL